MFISTPGDIKLPGAERRSDYYRRHGNPNYGGAVGLLSRSYRRRAKNVVPSADVRSVSIPLTTQTRNLVNYSDMDEDIHGITRHLATRDLIASDDDDEADGSPPSSRLLPSGRRREAVGAFLLLIVRAFFGMTLRGQFLIFQRVGWTSRPEHTHPSGLGERFRLCRRRFFVHRHLFLSRR